MAYDWVEGKEEVERNFRRVECGMTMTMLSCRYTICVLALMQCCLFYNAANCFCGFCKSKSHFR